MLAGEAASVHLMDRHKTPLPDTLALRTFPRHEPNPKARDCCDSCAGVECGIGCLNDNSRTLDVPRIKDPSEKGAQPGEPGFAAAAKARWKKAKAVGKTRL